jgi:hypothetical protein
MSINYNAIVGNKSKVTLPSVEAWGTNNNILKDPPKSIMTRRIDKVGQDGSINEMLYESGDRFAEAINVYARGTNPMVSVQYNNANGAPVKLPYRIIREGAFRPPVLRQEQLLPLSRQPRNLTRAITNKGFVDYSKRVTCAAPDSNRYFKEQPIKATVTPNKYVKIEVPVEQHLVVNYINENPVTTSAITNLSSKANIQLENQTPNGQAMKEALQYAHSTNPKGIEQQNYIHDDLQLHRTTPLTAAVSQKSSNINVANTPDNEIVLTRNIPEYKIASKLKSNVTRLSDDHNTNHELQQKLVAKSVIANKNDINGTNDFTRTVNLAPALQQGGYSGTQSIPMTDRITQYNTNYTTGKTRLAQRVKQVM